jgi:hypothetical protein
MAWGDFFDNLGNSLKPKSIGISSAAALSLFGKLNGLKSDANKIDSSIESLSILVSLDTGTLLEGYLHNANGNLTLNASYRSYIFSIEEGIDYYVSTVLGGDICSVAYYYGINNTYLGYEIKGVNGPQVLYTDYKLTLPVGTVKIGVTSVWTIQNILFLKNKQLKQNVASDLNLLFDYNKPWKNKKIVWFGTSIPAGSSTNNYPSMLATVLEATVINEAIGSSPVRASYNQTKTGLDIYGWGYLAWPLIAYSLSGTLVEKQYLIDNWNYFKTRLTGNPPVTLSDNEKAKILDCSWENKLNRHLGTGNRADLYVFDHGHNDNWGSDITAIPTDIYNRDYFIGAMNFLINKILTDNPKAKICFIGHYENDRKTEISIAQTTLAETWDFPFLKLWEKLGWTQKTVLVSGVTKTMTQIWMVDDLHPHTDSTGSANKKILSYLVPFFNNEVR